MKLIMVDLDGTLLDTSAVNYEAYRYAMKQYGYSLDYEYYRRFCNGRNYLDFLPQLTTDNEDIVAGIHRIKTQVYSGYLELARVNSSLVELLSLCRSGYNIAMVTTASKGNTYEILNRFKLTGLFDIILTREDVERPKPDPQGYLLGMEIFGAAPEETVIFEDSDVGVEAAEKTGAVIYVVKGYN